MPETAIKSLESKHPSFFNRFREEIVDADDFRQDLTVQVRPGRIRDVIRFLKTENSVKFEIMMDLFAMDYLKFEPEHPERYAVVYNLYSITSHDRLFLKAYLPEEKPQIDSICEVYKAANWFEREAFDLFGIQFQGHPNLIRILCHHEFVGHPLRKDYPADRYQQLKTALPSEGL